MITLPGSRELIAVIYVVPWWAVLVAIGTIGAIAAAIIVWAARPRR